MQLVEAAEMTFVCWDTNGLPEVKGQNWRITWSGTPENLFPVTATCTVNIIHLVCSVISGLQPY